MRSSVEKEVQPEEAGEADMDIDSEEEEERRYQAKQSRRKSQRRPPVVTEVIDLSEDEQTSTAEQQLGLATQQAGWATQQAGWATQQPGSATQQAGLTTQQAGLATQQAGLATQQAGFPTQQAGLAAQQMGGMTASPRTESPVINAPLPLETLSTLEPPPPPPPPPEEPELPPPMKKAKTEGEGTTAKQEGRLQDETAIRDLKRENEELKVKLENAKKEEPSMREKETQIKALQLAFVNMQQQLRESKAKLKSEEERRARESVAGASSAAEIASDPSVDIVREMTDGALMSFISIFLHTHPFGASIDYLYSYLLRLQPGVTQSDIGRVLQRHPNCFTEELTGVGASIERRWKFIAFENALNAS